MKLISQLKERMINYYMTEEQQKQISSDENTLDIVTASYVQEINFPVPRCIKLDNAKQVQSWFIKTNKKMVITLTADYWNCWYNVYWRPVNGNKRTDISQSYWIEPEFYIINVVSYNYRDNDNNIENIEQVEAVPIDQVISQTGNLSLMSEVVNPLLLVETIK